MNLENPSEELLSFPTSSTEIESASEQSSSSPSPPISNIPNNNSQQQINIESSTPSIAESHPSIEISSITGPATAISEEARVSVSTSASQSHSHSVANSIHSDVSLPKKQPTNTVKTGSGGLRLNTLETSSTISQDSSIVNFKHSRPPSVMNGNLIIPKRAPPKMDKTLPIAINRLPQTSHYRFDDDNISTMSTSSLATSFSKSFLFGFLNNKQKDKMKSNTLLSKEYWMKDETSTECFICGRLFTTFRRKHHCRICGQIFCSSCTTLISGEKFNHNGKMRVCKTCIGFATDYNDSSDESSILEDSFAERSQSDLLNGDQDSTVMLASTPDDAKLNFQAPTPPPRMAIPATRKGESVEIPVSRSFNSRLSSIHTANFGRRKNTFERPNQHAQFYRVSEDSNGNNSTGTFKQYPETSFADYINAHNNSSSDAFNFNTNNNEEDHPDNSSVIHHQSSDSEDEGSMSIYAALHLDKSNVQDTFSKIRELKSRPSRANTRSLDRAQASLFRMRNRRKSKSVSRSQNAKQSTTSMINDFNLSGVSYSSPNLSNSISFSFGDGNLPKFKSELNDVCLAHFKNLLRQSLEDEEVPNIEEWEEVLIPLLQDVEKVEYNVRNGDNMDIRQYVKLKRLVGGKKSETSMVNGVVFSKTLALKSMPRHIENPRIALIMFPLEYMRTGQHFMSLEPVLAQEKEYINKLVARIIALNPDVVFVGASVSGLALKLLDEANIAVAYNMKPQIIERIARLTQADIVISMDKLALNLKLGTCESLDVKTYAYKNITKTVIYLSGCDPRLGSTLLIRGGDEALLRSVKEASEFMVYSLCNLKLETSFYRDNFMYLSQTFYDSMIKQEIDIEDMFGSEFLRLFYKRILSTSPTVEFEPPYLLQRTRQIESKLIETKTAEFSAEKDRQLILDEIKLDATKFDVSDEELQRIAKCLSERAISNLDEGLSIRKRQWELFNLSSPFMLDPQNHQKIAFLYSMVSSKSATPCIGPHPLQIDYYWDTDMTLGQYVEHLILAANNICSEGCGESIADHYRSYVHGNGKVDVILERFQSRVPTLKNVILTWTYCKQCGHTSPFLPMSETTWKFSFGKFLELLFWSKKNSSTNLGNCPHDFAKDHIKYFSLNDLTVRMEYSKVDLLELVVPRTKLLWKVNTNIKLKIELHQQVSENSTKFFNSILARLNRVKVDSISNDKMEAGQKRIAQLKERVESEQNEVTSKIEEIYNGTDPSDILALNSILRFVQDLSVQWDSEFARFEDDYLPSEKDIARITAIQLKKFFLDDEKRAANDQDSELKSITSETESKFDEKKDANEEVAPKENLTNDIIPREIIGGVKLKYEVSPTDSSFPKISPRQGKVFEEVSRFEKLLSEQDPETSKRVISSGSGSNESKAKLSPSSIISTPKVQKKISTAGSEASKSRTSSIAGRDNAFSEQIDFTKLIKPRFGISTKDLEQQLKEGRQKSTSSNTTTSSRQELLPKEDNKVMKLTSYFDQIHFETLSKEFEMQRERERLKLIHNRYKAVPVSSSKPIVEVYKNVTDAVSEDEVDPLDLDISEPALDKEFNDKVVRNVKVLEPGIKDESLKADIPQTERVSLMKTLASFWADRSATLWEPLEYPLGSSEHIFADSDVIVREDEPSSLIAFCLSSSDYVQKINVIRDDEESQDLEAIMLKKTAVHLKYQFQEGNTLLSCKIFFAEQFDSFRRKCGLEDNFIQSLSRCVKWDSAGGKSGSSFLKTLDDRFVIKQLSTAELDSFVKFAPSYFEYMAQALFHDLPTVIAKIFGFYQIHIKNPIDGRNFKMDVLIMENLFYARKNLRIFDLKGSMRNRHVEQTGKENEVLLDENMVEYIYESPLFVREYDKKLLKASLWNDTLFLAKMNVMDYSLVIGIDDENKILTVGIIDCIRTFTWDKKLESWVKEKGLVGGGTKEPTVVTPRQYKNRFREAMDRYILMVPDSWFQGNGNQPQV